MSSLTNIAPVANIISLASVDFYYDAIEDPSPMRHLGENKVYVVYELYLDV